MVQKMHTIAHNWTRVPRRLPGSVSHKGRGPQTGRFRNRRHTEHICRATGHAAHLSFHNGVGAKESLQALAPQNAPDMATSLTI